MSIVEQAERHVSTRQRNAVRVGPARDIAPDACDAELLRQFVADRDERAFSHLVTRHASLVMGVCRRALGNEQDAEDAFQATFLILARKAARVRRAESLSAWLYQTAYRIALRARAGRARRQEQPLRAEAMIATQTFSEIQNDRDQTVLDEELNRLPEKYRLPLFLRYIEGKSREEAAEQLGLSPGAVKGRLERGRLLLRRRLLLRGVSLPVAVGVMAAWQQSAQAAPAVSPSLITSTIHAGVHYAAGQSPLSFVSENTLTLAKGSFPIMSWTTTKIVACCVLLTGALSLASHFIPAAAMAGSHPSTSHVLATQSAVTTEPVGLVAFLADDEQEGRRSPEAEAGPRRSPEAEAGPRRSPEAEAGPRRSPEAEAGPRRSPEAEAGPRRSPEAEAGPRRSPEAEAGTRRSPEAEAGPRRSPEAEAGPRRSAEGDRGPRRSAEREAGRERANPLQTFRPQTQREAALYQMILQLQRELGQLRQEVARARGARDGGDREGSPRDGDYRPAGPRDGEISDLAPGWERTKIGGVFRAYDKNGDDFVALEEWLAMTNGNISPERRALQTRRFLETRPGDDNRLSPAEFFSWWNNRPGATPDRSQRAPRDGEGGRSAEGDAGYRRSPEGDSPRRSTEAEAGPRRSPERER